MPDSIDDLLTLTSELADLARLAPWLDHLAERLEIHPDARFAIELCLEEALANVIRHGYREQPGHPVRVTFTAGPPPQLAFTVEDQAPHFDPTEQPELPALGPDTAFRLGGQGVRLLHKFAHTLDYQALERGNRLRLGFLNQPRPA